MNKMLRIFMCLFMGVSLAGVANAAPLAGSVPINSDITVDTVLDASNVYHLVGPIFVRNGASLTIPAGTVIATDSADDGGLVVTRDSQIFILGTEDNPVIMTSTNDVATWDADATHPTGHDPKTGTWRETANEWRNLTILGNAVISAHQFEEGGNLIYIGPKIGAIGSEPADHTIYNANWHNPATPDGTSQKRMEGLDPSDPGSGDPDDIRYGGANDADDSGTIRYLSIRYTGRVLGTGDELNGLSLGALGSGTDIRNVEIMNNVDDGIEIWGGKFCLRNFSIWNVGDDSLDFDQGWRGKAQFGLIVQGYALDASQGSGTGDNCVEHDGGEQSDSQPTSTVTLHNLTVIGEPNSGDGATTWRDNANVQYRKCLFVDFGEELVRLDNQDGDGGQGYGFGGTLGFNDRWTTPWNTYPTVNAGTGVYASDANFYSAQTSGTLCEISDSVVYHYNGWSVDGGDKAWEVGVLGGTSASPANSGAPLNNVVATSSPISSLVRDTPQLKGGKPFARVTSINPLPANDAIEAMNPAEYSDECLVPVTFRGAFGPNDNWLRGWSASDAFGLVAGTTQSPESSEIDMTSLVSFDTDADALYLIESSEDGIVWTAVTTVKGDGATKAYADTEGFVDGKLYRATKM